MREGKLFLRDAVPFMVNGLLEFGVMYCGLRKKRKLEIRKEIALSVYNTATTKPFPRKFFEVQ